MSKTVTSTEQPIGTICYFMEPFETAPISLYIIHGQNGDMLIDTGFITTYSKLLKWIKMNKFDIKDIFITHAHPDHDWNAAKLQKMFDARIWIGAEDVSLVRNFLSQKQIPIAPEYAKKAKSSNTWGNTFLFKSKMYTPDVVINEDGTSIADEYGYDMRIVKLPGHTKGSIGILANDVLYCGDAFAVLQGEPTLPPHVVSMDLMKETWNKMIELSPQYVAPGHGLPIEMEKAAAVLKEAKDYFK